MIKGDDDSLEPVADYDYDTDIEGSRLIAEGPRLTYEWNRISGRSPAELLSSYGNAGDFEKIVREDVSDAPDMRDRLLKRDSDDPDSGVPKEFGAGPAQA